MKLCAFGAVNKNLIIWCLAAFKAHTKVSESVLPTSNIISEDSFSDECLIPGKNEARIFCNEIEKDLTQDSPNSSRHLNFGGEAFGPRLSTKLKDSICFEISCELKLLNLATWQEISIISEELESFCVQSH
nr:hypothetical protein Iba_chr05cCG1110 [Ipomoea batatas]